MMTNAEMLQQKVDPRKLMNDFFAAIDYLRAGDRTTRRIGIASFHYRGGVCHAATVAHPELGAAVQFYSRQARPEDVLRIRAPMLLQFAQTDPGVNATWPAFEAAGKTHEAYVHQATGHGFHNDSTRATTKPAAKVVGSDDCLVQALFGLTRLAATNTAPSTRRV